jgi:oligoendopeptidase F
MSLAAQATATVAFAEPELLQIGVETLRQWIDQEPRLAIYGHYLDRLERRQPHVRSSEVEELLSQATDPFRTASATHGILADADLRFAPAITTEGEELEVGQGSIGALLVHPDRDVRRTAWESYADAHLAYKNTMANCLMGEVKRNVFMARARRYDSALEASVTANDIPVQVYHNVVETFRKNLPIWHRYWRIRREALNYEQLHVYDIKAPLVENPPVVPFEQAVEHIATGLKPLGDEYVDVMRQGVLEERWVDVYPNKGKRAGAYSTGVPDTYPFILMSYVDDLFSLSTLAHELGHSLHSYYTWNNQPFVYTEYTIFVAEVASNLNQALVRDHLFRTQDDPDFQIALIEEAMSNFHRYFFIMPTLARFELEIHERVQRGEALSADGMIELMNDLFAEGYGQEVVIDKERIGITWAEFPTHLYSNFYVYQYTTGISAAQALARKILDEEAGALDRYMDFLRAGGSLFPLNALQRAGVDLTTPEPIETAFAYLSSLIDRLERLLAGKAE